MHINSNSLADNLPMSATNASEIGQPPRVAAEIMHYSESKDGAVYKFSRRALDIVVSAILIVVFFPLFALISLAIWIDSPGPIFFVQTRCGYGDRNFKVWKFRTMALDAEQRLADLLAESPEARAEYDRYHKLSNDPRITRIGRFLRKASLDELPQLLNTLKGEMSLIGPRPYLPSERPKIGPALPVILSVRPGVTGLWQVTARNNCTFAERVAIDCAYVRQRSLKADLHILVATVAAVVKARGAC
jgi:Sugar transferases involved in lipopolysaccharide synthesis